MVAAVVVVVVIAVAATDIGIIIAVIKSYYLSADSVYVIFVGYNIKVLLCHYVSN